jgi:hypothetical protein
MNRIHGMSCHRCTSDECQCTALSRADLCAWAIDRRRRSRTVPKVGRAQRWLGHGMWPRDERHRFGLSRPPQRSNQCGKCANAHPILLLHLSLSLCANYLVIRIVQVAKVGMREGGSSRDALVRVETQHLAQQVTCCQGPTREPSGVSMLKPVLSINLLQNTTSLLNAQATRLCMYAWHH